MTGSRSSSCSEQVRWARINNEPFEYAIQRGPHGDEFVKLLDGSCLHRPVGVAQAETSPHLEALLEIRLVANQPGDRRALVDKIYDIATRASRLSSTHRACTCHPDEAPVPCQKKHAFSECKAAAMSSTDHT